MTLNSRAKHSAETGVPEQSTGAKRAKLAAQVSKDPDQTIPNNLELMNKVQEIVSRIEALLSRVGKKQIGSPGVTKDLQNCFPEVIIQKVMGCKGADRRWGPPKRNTSSRSTIEKINHAS